MRENGGSTTGGGIQIAPTSGAIASVTLDGVEMIANTYGMGLSSSGGTVVGVLRHSIISGSKISGLVAAGGGSPIFFHHRWFDDHEQSELPAARQSPVTTPASAGPGIVSFKNNQISGNATDGTPLAPVPSGLQ